MFIPPPPSSASLLVADPQAEIWNVGGITSINQHGGLQEEDQITQVTDPSAGLHEQDLHDLAKTTQGGTVVPPRSAHQTHN